MSMKNFRAEDMPMKVAIAKDSKSAQGAPRQARNVPATSLADQNTPPDGTSKEIMDWVGDDKTRAQAALDKEQADEKPRVGLSEDLQKIVDAEAEVDDDDDDEAADEGHTGTDDDDDGNK